MQMSEARYNDLVYLLLKKLFLEPIGVNNPRECDIRICMQIGCPALRTGIKDAILLPNERSGRSHTKMVDIEYRNVFDVCLTYIEEHWLKMSLEEAYQNPKIKEEMWEYAQHIFEAIWRVAEEKCATEE